LNSAETLIEELVALEPIKTWSLIVTLFGDMNGKEITGKDLGLLLGRVGIKTEAMRVALHRLRKDGWIESTKSGREVTYRLSSHGLSETRAAYEDVYRQDTKYPDGWVTCWVRQGFAAPPLSIPIDKALVLMPATAAAKAENVVTLKFDDYPPPKWFSSGLVQDKVLRQASRIFDLAASAEIHRMQSLPQAAIRLILLHHWRKMALRPAVWAHISLNPKGPLALCHGRVTDLLSTLPNLSPERFSR
jgi:phenylacetic acid degradation operon negative regulatory protein